MRRPWPALGRRAAEKKMLAEFVETIIVLPICCVKEDRRCVTKVTKIMENEIPPKFA